MQAKILRKNPPKQKTQIDHVYVDGTFLEKTK